MRVTFLARPPSTADCANHAGLAVKPRPAPGSASRSATIRVALCLGAQSLLDHDRGRSFVGALLDLAGAALDRRSRRRRRPAVRDRRDRRHRGRARLPQRPARRLATARSAGTAARGLRVPPARRADRRVRRARGDRQDYRVRPRSVLSRRPEGHRRRRRVYRRNHQPGGQLRARRPAGSADPGRARREGLHAQCRAGGRHRTGAGDHRRRYGAHARRTDPTGGAPAPLALGHHRRGRFRSCSATRGGAS